MKYLERARLQRRIQRIQWKAIWRPALIAAALMLMAAVPALAASDGTTVYRALLIGNSTYADKSISNLKSCANDVKAMRQALQSGSIGYDKIVTKANQTAAGLSASVKEAALWGADDDDVTVFFYSGHGVGNGLVGASFSPAFSDVYSFTALQNGLSGIPGKVIVLLDACYSGGLIGKSAPAAYRADAASESAFVSNAIAAFSGAGDAVAAKGVASKTINKGTKFHVIASSSKNEESFAITDTYGAATWALTEAMGWAHNGAKAGTLLSVLEGDKNGDGIVTMAEAFAYAASAVSDVLNKYGYQQNMQIYPVGSGQTLIRRSTETPKVVTDLSKLSRTNAMNFARICIAPGETFKLNCGKSGAYWTSSRPAVASVNPSTGLVTGVKASTAHTATVMAVSGNTYSVCEVRVLPSKYVVRQVRLRKAALSIQQGATYAMAVRFTPASARYKKIVWTSSDPSVATVSAAGKIKAVAKGTATITATATSGVTASCAVTVTGAKPKSVALSSKKLALIPGQKATLTQTVKPTFAEDKSVAWLSSRPNIATVNQDGQVTAVAVGKAVVRAMTANGKKAYCTVTVVPNQSVPRTKPRSAAGKLTSSARKIYYGADALYIQMFFHNRTRGTVAVPSPNPGLVVLRLKSGAKLTAPVSFAGVKALRSGRYLVYTMKLELSAHPKFKGLNLRGADAWYEAVN